MRKFNELVDEIEVDGVKLIPIMEIAQYAFNYNKETVLTNSEYWINNSYDFCAWFRFRSRVQTQYFAGMSIDRDFNIQCYDILNNADATYAYNQASIFKLLTQWGFIDNSPVKLYSEQMEEISKLI